MTPGSARILNCDVTRPKPSAKWSFKWTRHPGLHSAMQQNRVEVTASYAADMTIVTPPVPEGEPFFELPNSITIEGKMGYSTPDSIRLSRAAAEQLIEALQAALAWDGA